MVFFFCILQKALTKAEAAGCTSSRLRLHHSEGVCAVDGIQTSWHWPPTPWRSCRNWFWSSSDLCSSHSQNPFSSSTSTDWELGTATSIRLSLRPPGQAGEHRDSRVLWLLHRVRHHLCGSAGWHTDSGAAGWCAGVLNCLRGRSRCVRSQHCVSGRRGSAVAGRHTVSLPQRITGAWAGCIGDTVGGNSVTWCDQSCAQLDVTGTKELIVDLRRTLRYLWAPDWSCCSQCLSCVSRIHPPCRNGQRAPAATQPVGVGGPNAGGEPQELPQSWSRSLFRGSGPFSCGVWCLVWL